MSDWSEIEVELIVSDYFEMLLKELRGISYVKKAYRDKLRSLLNNRSDGSIEFKHQNISAALVKNGFPYLKGYKPRWNYQHLLEQKILKYLGANPSTDTVFTDFATREIKIEDVIDFSDWTVAPPETKSFVAEPEPEYYRTVKKNYLEMEQKNASIGEKDEELVYNYEKWRLNMAGKPQLADSVRWITKEEGDGRGFDILSRTLTGKDMYIEVKSTTLGKETPIFFSQRENEYSNKNAEQFHLYRVFDLNDNAKMFQKKGRFIDICAMEAVAFKGIF